MGTSCKIEFEQSFTLQKQALRLMYFSDSRAHAIPLFVRSGVLPLNMLYFKYTAILMHNITTDYAPSKISELFICSDQIHSDFQLQVIFTFRDPGSTNYYYLFLGLVREFGTKFPLSYASKTKHLSSINYTNYY